MRRIADYTIGTVIVMAHLFMLPFLERREHRLSESSSDLPELGDAHTLRLSTTRREWRN